MEIACIVEGDGEKQALPVLVRRIVAEIDPSLSLRVFTAVSWPKSRLVKRDHLSRALDVAVRGLRSPGAVLIVVDADDHCPAELGPGLLRWAEAAQSNVLVSVVIANREYEAWFLAAAESLRGHQGVDLDIVSPANSEGVRDAKGWLEERMPSEGRYNPIRHQASFSATMDLALAQQRSSSFDKLCRDVRRLVEALKASGA